jgi:hypothetical protein
MDRHLWVIMAVFGLLVLAGCAGTGEVATLNLHAVAPADKPKVQSPADAIIVVSDFEDARTDRQRAGARAHLGGGETVFNVPDGKVGEAVAKVVTDYLKKRGWNVQSAKPAPGTGPDGGPHVTISGKVMELLVNAASSFGSTRITSASKTVLEALNAEDGSAIRITVSGSGTQTVMMFDPEDAGELLSEVLSESLEKFLTETKFERKSLRLKK